METAMNSSIRTGMAALVLVLAAGSVGAQAPQHQAAVWKVHDLDFQYMGFTSRFSCSGLRDEMRTILLRLGARADHLEVTPSGCSNVEDRPGRISGVQIHMETLEPASGSGTPVDAQWKQVVIGGEESDDCELYEQIEHDILPLFTTRNVKSFNFSCMPHQATAVPPRVRLEVLSTGAASG
jgi:hypothetical protein